MPATTGPKPPVSAKCTCEEVIAELRRDIALLKARTPIAGPPGRDGLDGTNGIDGKDAKIDEEALVKRIKREIQGSITVRVEPLPIE